MFTQVKVANPFKNLQNEICLIYALYRATVITKKVYMDVINSTKL